MTTDSPDVAPDSYVERSADDLLDELVERIRVASFEAPKAGSHTEWSRRIKSMFGVVCSECGISEDQHDDLGTLHESGEPAFDPLVFYVAQRVDPWGAQHRGR